MELLSVQRPVTTAHGLPNQGRRIRRQQERLATLDEARTTRQLMAPFQCWDSCRIS
jgi:hypothetical protein